jgi:hypothetical protein
MKAKCSQEAFLRQLEERLLQPEVRKSAQEVADLLADEFIEFGSSGRVFDKQQVIQGLQHEPMIQRSLGEFQTSILARGVILVTYRAIRQSACDGETTHSLRSSIWKLIDGRWQMVFHQGTLSEVP